MRYLAFAGYWIGVIVLAAVLAGCGPSAPSTEGDTWVRSFCDHGNRVYVYGYATHGVVVVPRDPSCVEAAR